jgi:hypothetical protein
MIRQFRMTMFSEMILRCRYKPTLPRHVPQRPLSTHKRSSATDCLRSCADVQTTVFRLVE